MEKKPFYLKTKFLLATVAVLSLALVALGVSFYVWTSSQGKIFIGNYEESGANIIDSVKKIDFKNNSYFKLPETGLSDSYTCTGCVLTTGVALPPSSGSSSSSSSNSTDSTSKDGSSVGTTKEETIPYPNSKTKLGFEYTPKDSVLQVGKTYDFDIVLDPNYNENQSIMGAQVSFKFDETLAEVSLGFQKTSSPFEIWFIAPKTVDGKFQNIVWVKDRFEKPYGKAARSKVIMTSFTLKPLKAGNITLAWNTKDEVTGINSDGYGGKITFFRLILSGANGEDDTMDMKSDFRDLTLKAQ